MDTFHKILFASQALTDDAGGLALATRLARGNHAALSALIVCPEFPAAQAQYRPRFEESLVRHLNEAIAAAREASAIGADELPVPVEVDSGSTPAVRIIRHVLRQQCDLLVKQAEHEEGERGFKAVDMELLRKCPCPVWLHRPGFNAADGMRIGVAIDPQSSEPGAHALSLRLLQLGRRLADQLHGELHVVSCWNFPFEEYLRDNAWIEMADDEIDRTVLETQRAHRAALERVLQAAALGADVRMHHVRGEPASAIVQLVAEQSIDLLVMGTVARTGIPGFVFGNTAENVFRKLDCALVALKPDGFTTPVTAS